MKCLYELNVDQLNELVEKELYLKSWFIRDDKITKRTGSVQHSERVRKIKKQADKKGISYMRLKL